MSGAVPARGSPTPAVVHRYCGLGLHGVPHELEDCYCACHFRQGEGAASAREPTPSGVHRYCGLGLHGVPHELEDCYCICHFRQG